MAPADAEKLADAIAGWMKQGYVYSSALTPDYQDADSRPMPSRAGRCAPSGAGRDRRTRRMSSSTRTGLPNANYWRFVNDVSIFNYPQPNANGANPTSWRRSASTRTPSSST
jgi:hypothetical protein